MSGRRGTMLTGIYLLAMGCLMMSTCVVRANASGPSEAIRALADQANQLRSEIEGLREREDEQGAQKSARLRADILDRLITVGSAGSELPREPTQANLLLHLAQSLRRIDPDLETRVAEQPAAQHAATWLVLAESIAAEEPDPGLVAYIRVERAEIYERGGRIDEALRLARGAAFEAARAPHPDSLYRAQWLSARLYQRRSNRSASIESYRAAVRTLEAMRAEIAARSSEQSFAFRQQVEPVYLGLVDSLLREARDVAIGSPASEQAFLREARNVLEQFKVAELRDYFHDECLSDLSSTEADTIPGTVVVYPIALADRVEIIVSRDGRLSSHRSPMTGPELEQLARDFRRWLQDRITRRYQPRAEALYDALIRPIQDRLSERPIDTLVFVPGGALRQIPMGALRDREAGVFLIERYPIATVPSLTLTDPGRIDRREIDILVGGLTEAVQGFSALPNVADEIESVSESFPTRTLLDEDFVTARYEEALRNDPFDVVHLASHGVFSSDSSDSFILTWDGRMSIDRLASIIGQARFRRERPIQILVLSACETAVGDDRSALGLAGAAVRTGARSVVATLWSVDDAASSKLVRRFYAELADPANSRAEALQRAQLWMLSQPELSHPRDWAGFLLISSWL